MSEQSQNTLGVIVARFQVAELHEGHLWTINEVAQRHKHVLIMLGTTIVKGSPRNPLNFEDRKWMLKQSNIFRPEYTEVKMRQAIALQYHNEFYIDKIADHSSDLTWSKNVDAIITEYAEKHITTAPLIDATRACIYGARDSALPYYHGIYSTYQLEEPDFMVQTGTEARKAICENPPHSIDYRKGKIAATADRYPINYMCVDAVIYNSEKKEVLLGRKPGEVKFQFVGGFTDPTDESLEFAAAREAGEEVQVEYFLIDTESAALTGESVITEPVKMKRPIDINLDFSHYVGSVRINDSRYRSEPDKIMSAVIICETNDYGSLVPADDIEQVKWVPLNELVNEDIMEPHKVIVELLKKKWIHTQNRLTDEQVSKMFYD